jgi:hypothetical protein
MKDPLDTREDAYQRFNQEAKAQGKPVQVSPASRRADFTRAYGQLQIKCKNRPALQDAYDRLTKVDRRLAEDIYFYWVGDDRPAGEALPEPAWEGDQEVPLPELAVDGLLAVGAGEQDLTAPLEFRSMTITHSNRYDEAYVPASEVSFEK